MNQLELLKVFLPDVADDKLLEAALTRAERIILNRRYPFGYTSETTLDPRYLDLQLSIAAELVSKMGAEGETGHSESGVSRTYENAGISESLLRQIVPVAKCTFRATEESETE